MSDCQEWTGCKNNRGYGKQSYHGKLMLAHRVAWIKKYGEIPVGLIICHKCDNPACVNTDHLFLGTHQDNMRDCRDKGRMDNGGNSHRTHCKHGHEFTPENTYVNKDGERHCRACDREWHRRNYVKR